jgi:hypothetical protein
MIAFIVGISIAITHLAFCFIAFPLTFPRYMAATTMFAVALVGLAFITVAGPSL